MPRRLVDSEGTPAQNATLYHGRSIYFDGAVAYGLIPASVLNNLLNGGDWTINIWCHRYSSSSGSDWDLILGVNAGSYFQLQAMNPSDVRVVFQAHTVNLDIRSSGAGWHQFERRLVSVTWSAVDETIRIYLDGDEKASDVASASSMTNFNATADLGVGCTYNGSSALYMKPTELAWLAFYQRALPASELVEMTEKPEQLGPNLTGHWPMIEAAHGVAPTKCFQVITGDNSHMINFGATGIAGKEDGRWPQCALLGLSERTYDDVPGESGPEKLLVVNQADVITDPFTGLAVTKPYKSAIAGINNVGDQQAWTGDIVVPGPGIGGDFTIACWVDVPASIAEARGLFGVVDAAADGLAFQISAAGSPEIVYRPENVIVGSTIDLAALGGGWTLVLYRRGEFFARRAVDAAWSREAVTDANDFTGQIDQMDNRYQGTEPNAIGRDYVGERVFHVDAWTDQEIENYFQETAPLYR